MKNSKSLIDKNNPTEVWGMFSLLILTLIFSYWFASVLSPEPWTPIESILFNAFSFYWVAGAYKECF